jgi:hypothetical protein
MIYNLPHFRHANATIGQAIIVGHQMPHEEVKCAPLDLMAELWGNPPATKIGLTCQDSLPDSVYFRGSLAGVCIETDPDPYANSPSNRKICPLSILSGPHKYIH